MPFSSRIRTTSTSNTKTCLAHHLPPSGRPVRTTGSRRLVGATRAGSRALAPRSLGGRLPGRSPAVCGRRTSFAVTGGTLTLSGLGSLWGCLSATGLATEVRRNIAALLERCRLLCSRSGSTSRLSGRGELASGLHGLTLAPSGLTTSLACEVELRASAGLGRPLDRALERPAR